MTRADKITEIIEKRRVRSQKVDRSHTGLRALSIALENLEALRSELLNQFDDPQIVGRLREIDFSRTQIKIATELEVLSKLRVRFSRDDRLNIGVVGLARQGKSLLLQSLTGLSSLEIPDGDHQYCTGVRSIIQHNPEVETYGEVWFHSERSLLDEVIAPYYDQLHLGTRPLTLDEFSNPLPPLPEEIPGYAEPGAKYDYLHKYHENIEAYRPFLSSPSPQRVSREQIREYVAQDDVGGQRVYFNYLAVKEVKIVCTFPKADVGQIALIDMPGLGDTGIGDSERLLKTLGEEVDFILFVRMPRGIGDDWRREDVSLYDTANRAINDLPIKEWSFMVLNLTQSSSKNGDNLQNCHAFKKNLSSKRIDVVDCVIADCSNSEEVNMIVLDTILDYLTNRIDALDKKYVSFSQERIRQLQGIVFTELDKAHQALGKITQDGASQRLFRRLFRQLWKDISSGLEALVSDMREYRDDSDNEFKQLVDNAFKACKANIVFPTEEDIKLRRDECGSYDIAYSRYLNEIRTDLSSNFLTLDDGLKQSLENAKIRVTKILANQGRLVHLTEFSGSKFLEQVINFIPDDLSKLKNGFNILATFDLSYRGLIQHRIRIHLDNLTPDGTPLRLSQHPRAEEIKVYLEDLYPQAISKCKMALEGILSEPNQAAFAIVEEFVDQVLRAEDIEDEWEFFLGDIRDQVWPNEFSELGENTKIRRDWIALIKRVRVANQVDLSDF